VTATTAAIYDAFLSDDRSKTFFHGHSYTANALACAVAIASLDLFRDEAVLANVSRLEQQLRAGFDPLRALGDVRVIGGVAALELFSDGLPRSEKAGYLDQAGPRLAAAFLDRGLLLRPLGNVVYFMPPYCITESETRWALEQIAATLRTPLW
jgi:adenosylmethionine-8-amino-7-oxononanoate aminotransferase